MDDPVSKQTTPEAVYEAAQQFVWAFKNMQWNYAKIACERLQRTIEAVYWPREQSSSAPDQPNQGIPDGWCPVCGGGDGDHKAGCQDGSEVL